MIIYKSYIEQLRLVREPSDYKKVKIQRSSDIYEYMKEMFSDSIDVHESMFCLLLNRANNTIGWFMLSKGGINGTTADIKIITLEAIKALASNVILAHNHPSGNIQPSNIDKTLTKQVKQALNLFMINLLDHLIVTEDDYYSFADNGEL